MVTLLGYINLLLVLMQPAHVIHEPVLQEEVILPITIKWVQPVLPDIYFQTYANQATDPEAVTHSNKVLLDSGSLIIKPINGLRFKVYHQLHNKRRNSVKLFILHCQMKSELCFST